MSATLRAAAERVLALPMSPQSDAVWRAVKEARAALRAAPSAEEGRETSGDVHRDDGQGFRRER